MYLPIWICTGSQCFPWVKRALDYPQHIKINLSINISYLTWKYSSMAKWVRAVLIIILVSVYNNIIIYIHEQIWMKKINCQSSMEHSLYFLCQDLSKQFKITVKLVLEKWLKRWCIFVGKSGIRCDFYSRTQICTCKELVEN